MHVNDKLKDMGMMYLPLNHIIYFLKTETSRVLRDSKVFIANKSVIYSFVFSVSMGNICHFFDTLNHTQRNYLLPHPHHL